MDVQKSIHICVLFFAATLTLRNYVMFALDEDTWLTKLIGWPGLLDIMPVVALITLFIRGCLRDTSNTWLEYDDLEEQIKKRPPLTRTCSTSGPVVGDEVSLSKISTLCETSAHTESERSNFEQIAKRQDSLCKVERYFSYWDFHTACEAERESASRWARLM